MNSAKHAEWIHAMGNGDVAAAAQLYDAYSARLFAVATELVEDSAEAEQVLFATFVHVWDCAPTYTSCGQSVETWLILRMCEIARPHVRRRSTSATAGTELSRA